MGAPDILAEDDGFDSIYELEEANNKALELHTYMSSDHASIEVIVE